MQKDNTLIITGGMGTGKSTVLSLFEKNGFLVINADEEVSALFKSTYPRYLELATDFDNYLGTNFASLPEIQKKELRPYLEAKPDGFSKSLEIVKPYLEERFHSLSQQYHGQKIVFEIPLLFEAGMDKEYANILVVTADMDIRIERIKVRQPHLNLEQINQTIESQLDEDYKIKRANFVIKNNSSLSELETQFNQLLPHFIKVYDVSI